MTSTILSLWFALLQASAPAVRPDAASRVEYAEADGWHYIVRKDAHYYVIQAGTPARFRVGDRLKTLHDKLGEQWVLINDTPRITSVLVNGYRLTYDQARILSAQRTLQTAAR